MKLLKGYTIGFMQVQSYDERRHTVVRADTGLLLADFFGEQRTANAELFAAAHAMVERITELGREVDKLQASIVLKDTRAGELSALITSKDGQVAQLQSEVKHWQSRADLLRYGNADLVAACEAKDKELMRKNAMITALKDALAIVSANRDCK